MQFNFIFNEFVFFLAALGPGVQQDGWLRYFAHPLGGVERRGYAQYPILDPNILFLSEALQK